MFCISGLSKGGGGKGLVLIVTFAGFSATATSDSTWTSLADSFVAAASTVLVELDAVLVLARTEEALGCNTWKETLLAAPGLSLPPLSPLFPPLPPVPASSSRLRRADLSLDMFRASLFLFLLDLPNRALASAVAAS